MRRFGRLSFVDYVLWGLRIAVVIGVAIGTWATLSAGRLEGDQWRSLVILGIAQGSLYALIALGYTLVYGVLLMINFAHGDVFMFGAMTAFFVADGLADGGLLLANPFIGLGIVLIVAMLSSMIVAILLERIAYRPLRRAPRLVPLITAIGASLFISNSVRGLYGEQVKAYPSIPALEGRIDILGIPILKTQAIVIVTAFVLMLVLFWFVNRTRTGRAMRAVSEDKDTAALMGINVDRTISTTFAIGGLLAGAAGVLYALVFGRSTGSWVPAGHQGVHRGGPRRHREHRRRHARGPDPRPARAGGPEPLPQRARRAVTEPAARRHRLQRARAGPDLPALRILGKPESR
jgi:branched-chain amino acid transport system permease protein